MHKKTQHGTDKVSEHNMRTLFPRYLVLLTCALTGMVSNSFYSLSYLHFTYSQIAPTYHFCLLYRNITPPPSAGEHMTMEDRI